MKIKIICVGKLKEHYLKLAAEEYCKRLSRYGKVQIIEVADEKAPESLSLMQEMGIVEKEGERILKYVKSGPNDFVIALAILGKQYTSEELAAYLGHKFSDGVSTLTFIIGGSLGLSEQVLKQSDLLLSFSKFTFPHQLMRVILLEQLYRMEKIRGNEPYHK